MLPSQHQSIEFTYFFYKIHTTLHMYDSKQISALEILEL